MKTNKIQILDVSGQKVSGQNGSGTEQLFLHNRSELLNSSISVPDSRTELGGVGLCYAIWCSSSEGWWMSKMAKKGDRGGYKMFSICIGSNRPVDGAKAVKVLDEFEHFFGEVENRDHDRAETKIKELENDFGLTPCKTMDFATQALEPNSAFRTYSSADELSIALTFISQKGYEKFSRIFFIPQSESSSINPKLKCLDDILPIIKSYTVISPIDCECKDELAEGEKTTIIYKKHGRDPKKVEITGGVASPYVLVDRLTMQIVSAENANIRFTKSFDVFCKDKSGVPIENKKYSICNQPTQNGVKIDNGEKNEKHVVTIPEDFRETIKLRIDPNDNSFKQNTVEINPAQIKDSISVELERTAYKVVFMMNNERFETNQTMNPSEVKKEEWGTYEYTIDDYKQEIIFDVPESHKKSKRKKKEKPIKEKKSDTKKTSFGRAFKILLKGKGKVVGLVFFLLLFAAYIIMGVIQVASKKPWHSWLPWHSVEEQEFVDEGVVDKRNRDIQYLADHNIWEKGALQDSQSKDFLDVIIAGKVDKILEMNNLFFASGESINETWKGIVDGLNSIQQSEKGNNKYAIKDIESLIPTMYNRDIDLKRLDSLVSEVKTWWLTDLPYMKSNDKWEVGGNHSDKYNQLYNCFKNGKVDSILMITDDLLRGKDDEWINGNINGNWYKKDKPGNVYAHIKRVIDIHKETDAENKIKEVVKNKNCVDLKEIVSGLNGIQNKNNGNANNKNDLTVET